MSPTTNVEDLVARDACAHAHGIAVDHMEPGQARVSMPVRADMLNPHGTCHGGILFLLADTALGLASNAPDGEDVAPKPAFTTTATVSYPAPAREGDVLVASASLVHEGARTGIYDVRVHRLEEGTAVTVALFRGNTLRV